MAWQADKGVSHRSLPIFAHYVMRRSQRGGMSTIHDQSPALDPIALGHAIRTARKQAGLSQQIVAEHLGIARTTLVAIEKGERNVRVYELTCLAEILGVELSSLLAESESIQIKERLLALSGAHARVIGRLMTIKCNPMMGKIMGDLYNTPALREASASTLIHLLIQQETKEQNEL